MKKARSSIVVIGVLALVTFALVAGVLSAAQKKAPVVVAARALEAITKLSLADVEVVQACTEPVERIHAGAVLAEAFETVEDVTGLVITVQRMPGDQVTADMVGDAAQNALAQALDPDHSNAVPAEATTARSTAPKVGASGTTTETVFTSGSTTTQPEPAVRVSPVELLTLLDTQAQIYLVMEPAQKGEDIETPGVYLYDLLPETTDAPKEDETEAVFVSGGGK